jgi:toxin ParE1/3/4
MSRLVLSPAARSDLLNIWEFLAYLSQKKADRTMREIYERFETLLKFPESGRRRDELKKGLRSFPVEKYLVFYFIIEDGIRIARILHSAQDIENALIDE